MPQLTAAEREALDRAVELAQQGPKTNPNPRVGAVLLRPDGLILAEGWHEGKGTAHAEAAAILAAQQRDHDLRGATAVVTLEPCNHTGTTGPCAAALLQAGITRVIYAQADPNPPAGGGAEFLAAHGVEVVGPILHDDAAALTYDWRRATELGRPWVILKTATSADGFVADANGQSKWITGTPARLHAHQVRSQVPAILVGTGTALADDPSLTARGESGELAQSQPMRVVVGKTGVPANAKLRGPGGKFQHFQTQDLNHVLTELLAQGVHSLVVEGGPTVAGWLLANDLVDELHHYQAPVLLGIGTPMARGFQQNLAAAPRFTPLATYILGVDVFTQSYRGLSHWAPAPILQDERQ